MFGSSSTTSSLASGRCLASVSVSMFCIIARHAEDNLNAPWIRSPPGGEPREGPRPGPTRPTPPAPGLPRRGSARAPVGEGGGPRADAELGVDAPDVILHGLLGQEQVSGDLPVGLAVRDERHDFRLARGQPVRLTAAVKSGSLAPVWPRDRAIVHLTSDCRRDPVGPYRSERTKNGRYCVNP